MYRLATMHSTTNRNGQTDDSIMPIVDHTSTPWQYDRLKTDDSNRR